jgi:hypothetical protein
MLLVTDDNREVAMSVVMHDYDDIEVTEATYTDTGESVDDDVIDTLLDKYSSKVFEEAYENAVMAAEYAMEGDR